MLIDGKTLPPNATLHSKFCVVGTGMGGAMIAQTLARRGQDVLVIEAGDIKDDRTASPIACETIGQDFGLPRSRCISLGGSSNLWHGICAALDDIDFRPRSWIPGSGWPIRRADLDRYYVAAGKDIGIEGADALIGPQLPPVYTPRLGDVGFNAADATPKLFLINDPPKRWKQGLVELARSERLKCIVNATALELKPKDGSDSIQDLVIGTDGRTHTVKSEFFIICAGALETPRLLLNSRKRSPNGVGNAHDLVGRNLLDHPMGHFSKLRFNVKTKAPLFAGWHTHNGTRAMVGLRLTDEQQENLAVANNMVWLRPSATAGRIEDKLLLSFLSVKKISDLTARQAWALLTDRDIRNRALASCLGLPLTYHYADLVFVTEQLPNPDSRVTLSRVRRDRFGYPVPEIDWRILDADLHSFDRYSRVMLVNCLKSPNHTLWRDDPLSEWTRTMVSSAHHLGTAKMGSGPRQGVVDSNLQVFGMRNLFIADASVFPTAGSANPSLTIMALALRLADHLLGKAVVPAVGLAEACLDMR